jgi:hypothetical protein
MSRIGEDNMSENAPSSSVIDTATKFVALVSLAFGVYATWKVFPTDAEIKRLQAESTRLDLALKKADADLKNIESSRKITLELYQEVKKVIEAKEKDQREEDAVRVLVEALADDPFRWKLLNVIAVGAKSKEVKSTAAATGKYYEEQSVVATVDVSPTTSTTQATSATSTLGSYNIDFFFCETKRTTSEPLARAALTLKSKGDTGRWRVRLLPESINQQPGYGVTNNQIRFTPPEERPIADAIAAGLSSKGLKFELRETAYQTPNYVSVFFCQ